MNRRIDDIGKPEKKNPIMIFLAIVILLGTIAGLIFISTYIGKAYDNYFAGRSGYVYELVLDYRECAYLWSGIFGAAVASTGYNNQQTVVVTGCGLYDTNLIFSCFQPNIAHEVMASLVPPTSIDWGSLQAAMPEDVDAYLGINSSSLMSATKTFLQTATFEIGNTQYIVPATYTKNSTGQTSAVFDLGILKDGNGNLIYIAHALGNFTRGFNNKVYNYQMILPVRDGTDAEYYFFTDPNDVCPEGEGQLPNTGYVSGNVTTSSGNPLQLVIVDVAGRTTLTDVNGFYNLSAPAGSYYIYGVKSGYQAYVGNITIVGGNMTYHNFVMVVEAVPNPNTGTGVGPGQNNNEGPGEDVGPGEAPRVPIVEQPRRIEGIDYVISLAQINRKLVIGNFLQEMISFYSYKQATANLKFSIEGEDNLTNMIKLDKQILSIAPNTNDQLTMTIFGEGIPGIYNGTLVIEGDLNEKIPITIELLPKDRLQVESLLILLDVYDREIFSSEKLKFKTDLHNLLTDQSYPVTLFFSIQDMQGYTLWTETANVYMQTSFSLLKSVKLPENLPTGDYILRVTANYLGMSGGSSAVFSIVLPFYEVVFWGLKIWVWIVIILSLLTLLLAGLMLRRHLESKKRYHNKVELSELPKVGPKAAFVGKLAETEHKTYFDLEQFKVHTIVAGATGGGKSVAAQVIVEEALLKNIAVIVFDPTAQWSGMLRKATDKNMLKLYPNFGMKPTQARAFNGNVRQIANALELIDIKKYLKPGEIHIFAMNKLDPKDIDIFVANSIREVFHANFPENPEMKLLIVYDEVHRLLPKFGGSGEGFLQIERGCREFRKWGIGILMISQVLADFVGQIKANINTEIQMRTRDEGDLDRITTKYGKEVLQGLVKASVGSGMVENPTYNRGKPYFVAFRPLLHNTQRLPDEELEKYNKYNELLDDLEFQIQQLEELKQDAFDLKLQLKLSADKVKAGNFNMVEIYLQELVPRIEKMWVKLGKSPKKREKRLVDIKELKADLKKAEESRKEFEKQNAKVEKVEEKEEKKALKYDYVVDFSKALNFSNGITITSLQELIDVMPNINGQTFKHHVTKEKNDIAEWIKNSFGDEELAKKILDAKTNQEYITILSEDKTKNNKPYTIPASAKKVEGEKAKEAEEKAPEVADKEESLIWNDIKILLKDMDIDGKIRVLKKAEEKYPKELNIKFGLALSYHKKKQYDISESKYKELLDISPNNPKALYYLGGLLKIQKKYDEALKYLENDALKNDAKTKEIIDKIRQKKG